MPSDSLNSSFASFCSTSKSFQTSSPSSPKLFQPANPSESATLEKPTKAAFLSGYTKGRSEDIYSSDEE
uniref:Uncharacterized protein n=1 Tax=Panagrolaimus davidi TaxID=227884 RepID=A0A914QT32_9BILA